MPTSVHIPKPLLVAVDRRAKALKVSRNRLIVTALEREVLQSTRWSPEFLSELEATDPELEPAVEEMLGAIRRLRRSKKPLRL